MDQKQAEPTSKSIDPDLDFLAPASGMQTPLDSLSFPFEKFLLSRMLRAIGDPPLEIVLWNGETVSNHRGNVAARVLIRDRRALFELVSDAELHFGELYSANRIEVQGNLLEFLEAVYRLWPVSGPSKIEMLLAPLFGARRNTLTRARSNIHHHYDIGNDFYKLWLDERMLYTCAYFSTPGLSLEDAQLAKLDHVCRKLRLKPGDEVVEAGCGWGGLAMHMASHYGAKVTAYNISKEQVALARQSAHEAGLHGRVEFIEDDYRNIRGKFDAFVSVGMLEHVGIENYRNLGEVIDRSLKENGRGLIHTIGLNYPRRMDAWTERHIFPGASLPSLAQMMQILEPFDFSVLDVENLRLHYARTLEHWLQRYEDNTDRVLEMYDPAFARAWRLYLAGAITTFKIGGMQLFQVTFARVGNNQLPWTRQYLNEAQGAPGGASHG